jgi:hypothetical protein
MKRSIRGEWNMYNSNYEKTIEIQYSVVWKIYFSYRHYL